MASRELRVTAKTTLSPNLKSLPANFTMEVDADFTHPTGRADVTYSLFSTNKETLQLWTTAYKGVLDLVVSLRSPKYEELGRTRITGDVPQPMKLGLWMQNGRVRIFVNGEKHLDFNQVELPAIDKVEITNGVWGGKPALGYRSVRFAESSPDFGSVIGKSGRFVTHGILFDTDSDRIKPESAAAIQSIAKGLAADATLKLLIEGHTDASGNAARNLDLSKRRSAAVSPKCAPS